MPVSYDASSLLKCTVSMAYLRYLIVDSLKAVDPPPIVGNTPAKQASIKGLDLPNALKQLSDINKCQSLMMEKKKEESIQIDIEHKKVSDKYEKSKVAFEKAREKMNNDELELKRVKTAKDTNAKQMSSEAAKNFGFTQFHIERDIDLDSKKILEIADGKINYYDNYIKNYHHFTNDLPGYKQIINEFDKYLL